MRIIFAAEAAALLRAILLRQQHERILIFRHRDMAIVTELHSLRVRAVGNAHDRASRQDHAVLPVARRLVKPGAHLLHHEQRTDGDLASAGNRETVLR